MLILPSQCRAARALIEMDQAELTRWAAVPLRVIAGFENGSLTPSANNLVAIRAALEAASVIFIDENGEGPGVRLRKKPPAMRFRCARIGLLAATATTGGAWLKRTVPVALAAGRQ